jgi:hypothetical protein
MVSKKEDEPIKAKRGRKSKNDLLSSLKIESFIKKDENISLNISEVKPVIKENFDSESNVKENLDVISDSEDNNVMSPINESDKMDAQKPAFKKRGRKPKGGKIVPQANLLDNNNNDDKPNVILHIKCSMKDLHSQPTNGFIDTYTFTGKNDLNYDLIGDSNININSFYNDKGTTQISLLENEYDEDDEDNFVKEGSKKDIHKKLKQLEYNLHINNVNNKKSACFWDTCTFDNPPIYIPKNIVNGVYNVYGCFCSPECGVAYLMNESIDSSTKFERYHLFNNIYSKIYEYKKSIKPAPNPYYMLDKYYGNLSIQEYRSLLRNERLFLIVDKPLTRVLPELHEDNDDFILNNKIIPSNNYQIKKSFQKKKQNKTSIVNEKFGITDLEVEI